MVVRMYKSAMDTIQWDSRLAGIKGARGVGKTTLLLQHIALTYRDQLEHVLYVSLDDLWFAHNGLADLVDQFVKTGGKSSTLNCPSCGRSISVMSSN